MARWSLIGAGAAAGTMLLVGVTATMSMVGAQAGLVASGQASLGDVQNVACTAVISSENKFGLTQAQVTNAATIITVGREMKVPVRGQIIAVATAMQESRLRNLNYGDRDSVGLFQQRPSSGWGTVAELTTPRIASKKFYDALLKVNGWQSMALTVAAQAVQRSGFPNAYAQWETLATTLVNAAGSDASSLSADCQQISDSSSGGTKAAAMVTVALDQIGEPYVWGATGPDAFDCSGLIVYSYRKVGIRLTIRTADQMYRNSDTVSAGSEQRGDLLFGDFVNGRSGHVMIVVRKGLAVEAPHTGDVVKLIPYSASKWKIGRLKSSVKRTSS